MQRIERAHFLKLLVLVFYIVVIISVYAFLHVNDISVRDLPGMIKEDVEDAGAWGPFIMIMVFTAQTIIPFATSGLNVISGALFGPLVGSAVVVIGLNISAAVSFFFGRYLGRHFVSENERGWVKKYDDVLTEQGFISTMAMRLLFFPFDFVSIGAGMTRMTYRQYALGSFLGTIPGAVTFAVLGEAFGEPRAWALFIVLMSITLGIAWAIKRSNWAKKTLFKEVEPGTIVKL
ncbi:TVP38/TMEM64 family protein [Candidatus Uhrbacteria bacterium]|nr:TVP38/TMEM64 family protein [Candidatus Uhrbacteria bacterium]